MRHLLACVATAALSIPLVFWVRLQAKVPGLLGSLLGYPQWLTRVQDIIALLAEILLVLVLYLLTLLVIRWTAGTPQAALVDLDADTGGASSKSRQGEDVEADGAEATDPIVDRRQFWAGVMCATMCADSRGLDHLSWWYCALAAYGAGAACLGVVLAIVATGPEKFASRPAIPLLMLFMAYAMFAMWRERRIILRNRNRRPDAAALAARTPIRVSGGAASQHASSTSGEDAGVP